MEIILKKDENKSGIHSSVLTGQLRIARVRTEMHGFFKIPLVISFFFFLTKLTFK